MKGQGARTTQLTNKWETKKQVENLINKTLNNVLQVSSKESYNEIGTISTVVDDLTKY